MLRVNPDTQTAFAVKPEVAVMGDYPTLLDIDSAYGKGFATEWLIPQLANLAAYTGAKNLTERQQEELARVIATEYYSFKVTDLLLFFYRFKVGYYGRFYGTVDPMVITCALRDFSKERAAMILQFESNKKQEENPTPAMSYEEWLEYKSKKNEQE